MAIVNRSLDESEQRKVIECRLVAADLTNGVSTPICVVPWPSVLDAGEIAAYGLSGSPRFGLSVNRFIVGSGFTGYVIAVGTSNVPSAMGTSGAFAMILPAAGSTLLNLQANDVIAVVQDGGSAAAAVSAVVGLSLNPIQDIKIVFGQI